jgi:hypothetical protein
MGKYTCSVDENHVEIVNALKQIGCSVYDASRVGGGFPDLVVGYRRCSYLLELKSEHGKLNKKQIAFRDSWNGNFAVVRTPMEAIAAVTNG